MFNEFSSQNDPRWADIKIGGGRTWGGRKGYACLSHCLLELCKHHGIIDSADPREWIDFLHKQNVINPATGYSPNAGRWATRFQPFRLEVDGWLPLNQSGIKKCRDYNKRGVAVFAMVDITPTTAVFDQHWVLITDSCGDVLDWEIADPATGKIGRLGDRYREPKELVFINPLPKPLYSRAIDMSQWQDMKIYDFTGVEFAYIRASYGGYADTTYKRHTQALADKGIPFSPYHFLLPDSEVSIDTQVDVFLKQISSAPTPTHMAIVDYETIAPAPSPDDLKRFIERYEVATGNTIAIYSRANTLEDVPQWIIGDRPILQAHYTNTNNRIELPYGLQPAIWQFSSTGHIYGHDGYVDQNHIINLDSLLPKRLA